jgi:hypothetical protein
MTAIQIPLYPPWDINKSLNPPTAGAKSKNKNLDGYTVQHEAVLIPKFL